MKKFTIILICIMLIGVSITSAQELVPVGLQKQLLVDDYVIAEKDNIARELGKPRKMGVVMGPSVPTDFHATKQFPDGVAPRSGGYWEFGRRLSVVWNDNRQCFQMLYRASDENVTGYAESKDGIHWTKPLISNDGKSNLITSRGKTQGTFFESSFMIDPTVPWGHSEKFKAVYNPGAPYECAAAIAHSSDGIHWTGYNGGKPATGRAADTYNQILWDPVGKRYMFLTRTDLAAIAGLKESRSSRIMVHAKGNDLLNHPTAWKTLAEINVDHPDNEVTKQGVPLYQMESMCAWVYENIYFGMMHVLTTGDLTGSGYKVSVADPDKRPEEDVLDFYIGTSRDGKDFDRSWIYAQKPFVPRGPDYSFDKGMLQPSSEIITRGDEHLIYYTGQYTRHHSPPAARKESGKVGLAILPLDRFISQGAGDKLGTITTKPFVLEGDTLQVNVDAGDGRFYAEILDADGEPIPGYTVNEARIFGGVDQLRLEPWWKGQKDLSSLEGKTIRLKFYLLKAKVYAFQIK